MHLSELTLGDYNLLRPVMIIRLVTYSGRESMSTIVHFIDVGQGNMVLVECANGVNLVVDCNITEDNKDRVLNYVADQIGGQGRLRAFVCTHRDADHMRGVRTLHDRFPIQEVWDSDYPGTSTDSDEYKAYMRLRRSIGVYVVEKKRRRNFGRTRLRFLSAKDSRLPGDANDQGIVLKVEQLTSDKSAAQSSTILTGDGSFATWKDGILKDYSAQELSSDILMAAHHGSLDFFDDPSSRQYFVKHIEAIKPAMSLVSVGPNSYGHPDETALRLYRQHSSGSNKGNKVYRTDRQHTMKLTLKAGGGFNLKINQ